MMLEEGVNIDSYVLWNHLKRKERTYGQIVIVGDL